MTGRDIIFLAKEWGQDSTSCDQVFEQLARHNRVIWVNSIGTRTPNLTSGADWRRILAKLRACFGGLRQIRPSAWLYQPVFIPLPFSRAARSLNAALLRFFLKRQARRLGMRDYQLWFFHPNGAFLIGRLDERVSVYYCVDEWSKFSHLDGGRVAAMETDLLRKVDVCFVTSEPLLDAKKRLNENVFLSLHGVDHEFFRGAMAPLTKVPDDIALLPRPVIGFFGGIKSHIDFDVLERLAERHPEWSLALIGRVEICPESLKHRANVHFLGQRPYSELPAYCKAFDVGIIPYARNEFIQYVNPIKLRQYLSAGLPVVSTSFPEADRWSHMIRIARDADDFVDQAEAAMREDTPGARTARSEAMRSESWQAKMATVCQLVERSEARKQQRGGAGARPEPETAAATNSRP